MSETTNTAPPLIPGDRVRYLLNGLGLIRNPGTVLAGNLGTYLGPGNDPDWHYTEPDAYPETICPVHRSMIESVELPIARPRKA